MTRQRSMLLMKAATVATLLCAAACVIVAASAADGRQEESYYDVLGLERSADDATISRHYRRLARLYHPDKQKGADAEMAAEAAERFSAVREAYEVLSDAEKRRIYDHHGKAGLEQHQNGGHRGFQHTKREPTKGEDVVVPLYLTLEEVYEGTTIRYSHKKQAVCPVCGGSGGHGKHGVSTCHTCGGSGVTIRRVRNGPFVQQVQQPCPDCGGSGEHIHEPCHACGGTKSQIVESAHEVYIEPGLGDGEEVVLTGAADESPDSNTYPGNLVFRVRTAQHPVFARDSRSPSTLEVNVTLTLRESLLGFKKTLTHLDGHEVTLEPRAGGAVTPHGTTAVLPGEGMPLRDSPGSYGRLRVVYHVKLPRPGEDHGITESVLKEVAGLL